MTFEAFRKKRRATLLADLERKTVVFTPANDADEAWFGADIVQKILDEAFDTNYYAGLTEQRLHTMADTITDRIREVFPKEDVWITVANPWRN